MSLSSVQIGKIVEDEFAKFAMVGSRGQLDLYKTDADDEDIDFEVHLKKYFWLPLGIQCKGRTSLDGNDLEVTFWEPDWVRPHDLLYYVFAHLDRKQLGVASPLFIVPSRVAHQYVSRKRKPGAHQYSFRASVRPESRDQYAPYRVLPSQVGRRLMTILEQAQAMGISADAIPASLIRTSGIRFVGNPRSAARRKVGLTTVQEGIISQNEFAKLVMLTSNGLLEANAPKTDDDTRDFEIHRRGEFGNALSIQVKARLKLDESRGRRLAIAVKAGENGRRKLPVDRHFHYFLAHFDERIMRFAVQFLVPSSRLHSPARRRKKSGWSTTFSANLAPDSHDRWVPFRIQQKELGRRLLALLKNDDITNREAA